MSNLSWWRSWHGAPMDHKYSVIAARSGVKAGIVSAVMWALLDYASQNNPRGSIEGFDPEEYAVFSGFTEQEITAVIVAMTDKGIIKNNILTNWAKRQPQREDDSYERVTKWRDLKRSVTQCNADDNTVTQKYAQIKDTDTDTDKEKEEQQPQPLDEQPERPEIFTVYEQNIGGLNSMIAATLIDAEEMYTAVWVQDAIAEAVKNNVRKWAYVEAILKHWKQDGRGQRKNGKEAETDEERRKKLADSWKGIAN